jgi:ribonucleoside-diphosphate reductase alpha chain
MDKVKEMVQGRAGLLTGRRRPAVDRKPAARPAKRSQVKGEPVSGVGRAEEIILTPLARSVLQKRYLRKSADGRVMETPGEMLWRVASYVAQAERRYGHDPRPWAREFYRIMACQDFLPNSPCLMNAGTELGQLAACFVLPLEDNIEGIFNTLNEAMRVNKSGGGTGFSFSPIRPKDDVVGTTGGVAAGPVAYVRVFNSASAEIKQGGRRHGANMGILRVDHPDIPDFIKAKSNPGALEQFNLSVGVTSEFMQKAVRGEQYETVNPRTGKPHGRLNARQVLEMIAEEAWQTGDPGLVFLDAVNQANPTPQLGEIEATNPCGEQPLLPYESCNLGSINLSRMVRNGGIDWKKLGETVRLAVRFMDDVIDINQYPLPQIERMSKANRKIGLGIMGLAHMLAKLRIPYESEEAVQKAAEVMRYVSETALESSRQLAKKRGPFPNFKRSVYAERGEPAVRNATRTTVAPTGTIAILADTSSGIEPIFALAYTRNALGSEHPIFDPVFKELAEVRGIYSEELARKIAETGSVQNIEQIPDDLKALFKTAYEIPAEQHVRMQAAVQKYTDNGVSKTVNLPSSATAGDVKKVFLLAFELGCKGVTVFRQGSRTGVLSPGQQRRQYAGMRERPKVTYGQSEKFETGCGSFYVHTTRDSQGLLEAFSNLGKGGGCPAQSEAMARLVSLCLRCNVDPGEIVRQLRGMRCPTACSARAAGKPVNVLSCPDAIAQAMLRAMGEEQERPLEVAASETCPRCGGPREPGRCGVCLACLEGGCDGA